MDGQRSHVLPHPTGDSGGVLFLCSTGYDPSSRTMTVRYRSASGTHWSAYEYREVSADLYAKVLEARPHGQQVVEDEIAPFHEVRRVGERAWQPLGHRTEATEHLQAT